MASGAKAAANAIPKLHAVTQIRSGIRKPWWQKRTLKVLGLGRLNRTVIMKNTESVNQHLLSVKNLIRVDPVIIHETTGKDGDAAIDTADTVFFNSKCEFDVEKYYKFRQRNAELHEDKPSQC